MAYIGVQPTDTFLSIASQQITGTGSATYTLNYSVSNEEDVAVFVNNVRQNVSSYTVSGDQLTLGGTISASDECWVLFLGRTVGTKTPAVGSVTNDMLAGSIANSKLANSSITLNGSAVSLGGSASVGGLIYLNTVTISSAVASINFNSTYINSTYDVYKLFFKNVKGSNDNDYMSMRFSFDNGSNIISGSSYGQATLGGHTGTASDVVNSRYYSSGSAISLIGQGSYAGNDTGEDAVGEITIFNSVVAYKKVQGHSTFYHTGGGMFTNQYSAELKSNRTDRLNYIQIFFGNGNITQGSFHLFGVKDA
jgi:hypothetical protein